MILLTALITGCAENRDSWEQIRESGVLRVGVDPTFPPFALAEGEEVSGIDIDLADALGEELGLKIQFSYFGYDGLYDALTTKQVDALISALVIVPERTKEIAYSTPYFDAGQVLVITAKDYDKSMTDMNGHSVAVELGALGHVMATEWESRLNDLAVQAYSSADEAMAAVASGKADAALVDNISALLFIHNPETQKSGLMISNNPVASEPFSIALRIDDQNLLKEINKGLERLKKAGLLDAIIDRGTE